MKIKLLLVITVLILVSTTLPAAGSSAQDAYPAPIPPGHIIGDDGGGGRASAPDVRETKLAEKIKPTPAPYPLPAPEAGTQAYPAPGQGLPGVTVFEPDPDDPDPQLGIPYVWGIFFDNDGSRKIFVTIELGFPDFELTGIACIMAMDGVNVVHCYNLRAHHYALGRMSYHSEAIKYCGRFAIQYAILGGIYADIRQPNSYLIACSFLPWLRRFWY